MRISVIISTYNSEEWLKKVLWGFERQLYKNFELVIADDGSGDATRLLIEEFKERQMLNLVHVWHQDAGFQKSRILNKAIESSSGEYLIFSDGDCIPRKDFIQVHAQRACPGYFLSGGYFMLPMQTSMAITENEVANGDAFELKWLTKNGLINSFKTKKLTSFGWKEYFLNFITPTKATWNGHNSSGWKADLVAVNGFNEDMQYGGQDRELGERLINLKIKSKQIRYSAICIHLDHKRGYKTQESMDKNRQIRNETRTRKRTWTENGIVKTDHTPKNA